MAENVQTVAALNLRMLARPTLFKEDAHKGKNSLVVGRIMGIAERQVIRTDPISGDQGYGLAGYFEIDRTFPAKVKVDGKEADCKIATSNRLFLPNELHDMVLAKMVEVGKPATEKRDAVPGAVEFCYSVSLDNKGAWSLAPVVNLRAADPLSALRNAKPTKAETA